MLNTNIVSAQIIEVLDGYVIQVNDSINPVMESIEIFEDSNTGLACALAESINAMIELSALNARINNISISVIEVFDGFVAQINNSIDPILETIEVFNTAEEALSASLDMTMLWTNLVV